MRTAMSQTFLGVKNSPSIPPEIRADKLLVCLSLHVRLRVEKGVPLQLGHDVCQYLEIELDSLVRFEDVGVAILDLVEQGRDAFVTKPSLSRDRLALLPENEEPQIVHDFLLVQHLAEDELLQFVEGFGFLYSLDWRRCNCDSAEARP